MTAYTIHEIDQFKCWIQDGILHGIYKKDSFITLDVAKQIVKMRLASQNGDLYPAIAYVNEMHVVAPAARKYFAKEGYEGLTKLAIIMNSKVKSAVINVYVMIDKPVKPTRVFTNKEDAVKWLMS